jgi:hypothetical protein
MADVDAINMMAMNTIENTMAFKAYPPFAVKKLLYEYMFEIFLDGYGVGFNLMDSRLDVMEINQNSPKAQENYE